MHDMNDSNAMAARQVLLVVAEREAGMQVVEAASSK